MPRQFSNRFVVTYQGEQKEVTLDTNLRSNSCRDVAFDYMRALIWNSFKKNLSLAVPGLRQRFDMDAIGLSWPLAWKKWVEHHADRLRFTAYYFVEQEFPLLNEFHIPQTIKKLQRKFPVLEFAPTQFDNGFKHYFGVSITGDVSVLAAWYLCGMILRLAQSDINPEAREDRPWKDVNKLIERSNRVDDAVWSSVEDKENHIRLWSDILAGNIPSGKVMLQRMCGPIQSRRYEGVEYDYGSIAEYLPAIEGLEL
jgi:hypothetical protein